MAGNVRIQWLMYTKRPSYILSQDDLFYKEKKSVSERFGIQERSR